MESARLQHEQTKKEPIRRRPHKVSSAAGPVSHRPLILYDSGSPALRLGQAFGPSQTALLNGFQTKLTISEPGDQYEQEADRVAEQVMRMPEPTVRLQRRCGCGDASVSAGFCRECASPPVQLQRAARGTNSLGAAAPPVVHDVLRSPGQPLDSATRSFMQPRFGHDFSHVRVHINSLAAESAAVISALAYTVGPNVVFGAGQYRPGTNVGDSLVAHELVHVIQQGAEGFQRGLQRYGDPIPTVAHPTVTTMRQFIDLVRRFEAANPVLTALAIAQRIMRSKYHSRGFDWLLPSTSATPGVAPSAAVTAADVTTLSGEFTVTLPQGGETDPSHIVAAIVAAAETQAPGAGGAGGTLGRLVQSLPAGLSQLDVASWAGDPGSAAAEWMAAHPLPNGGTTKQDYMEEYSPQSDLIGDIDGVAMALAPASSVFQFNHAEPLSHNLERFYFPRVPFIGGKDRRFHIFCAVEGFALAANNVTLSSSAIANIDNRIHLFATWFTANDPNIQSWMILNSPSPAMGMSEVPSYNPIWSDWASRGDDWHWFAQQFRAFLQRNLAAEGA